MSWIPELTGGEIFAKMLRYFLEINGNNNFQKFITGNFL